MVNLSGKASMWQHAEGYWRNLGWAFNRYIGASEPRADFWHANRGQEHRLLWGKYSKYHAIEGRYWFGVDADWLATLANEQGGALFMLENAGYAFVPFGRLLALLSNATRRKNGQITAHMQVAGSALTLLPVGTRTWQDITRWFGLRDL